MTEKAKEFEDFFLKLVVLNYKIVSGIELDKKSNNLKDTIFTIIPIFNRILSEKTLSLENVINDDDCPPGINIREGYIDSVYDHEYPFVNNGSHNTTTANIDSSTQLITFANDTDKNSTQIEANEVIEVIDVEGDRQVEELHKKSLEKLDEYIKNNMILVEEDTDDTDENTSENNSDDNISDEHNKMIIDNKENPDIEIKKHKNINHTENSTNTESFESFEISSSDSYGSSDNISLDENYDYTNALNNFNDYEKEKTSRNYDDYNHIHNEYGGTAPKITFEMSGESEYGCGYNSTCYDLYH